MYDIVNKIFADDSDKKGRPDLANSILSLIVSIIILILYIFNINTTFITAKNANSADINGGNDISTLGVVDIQTDKKTNIQTDTQTDTQTNIQTDKKTDKTKFIDILRKILNPPIVITEHKYKNITYKVIRDDMLIGGTKQRALWRIMLNHPEYDEYVYGGPSTGYAQVALSYTAYVINTISNKLNCDLPRIKVKLFIAGADSNLTVLARRFGADISNINGGLAVVQEHAHKYVAGSKSRYDIPIGINSDEYRQMLVEEIKYSLVNVISNLKDMKKSLNDLKDMKKPLNDLKDMKKPLNDLKDMKRLWMTFGSGTLLKVFHEIWPDIEFMPVRVGMNIWEDQFTPEMWEKMGENERIQRLRVVSDAKLQDISGHAYQRFGDPVPYALAPPWPALLTYDAKVWQRFVEYGQDGDFIWTVGRQIDKDDIDVIENKAKANIKRVVDGGVI